MSIFFNPTGPDFVGLSHICVGTLPFNQIVTYFRSSFVQATPERVDPSEPGLELRTTTEQLGVLQAVVEEPELVRSPEIPLDIASPEHTHQHQLIRCCISHSNSNIGIFMETTRD